MDTSVVQTFFNEEFGELRTIRINNEIWFVAADVCKILGLSNPTVAISRLDADEKAKFRLGLSGGDTNCVNEPGLYRLIFMSHKPEAKKIQRWIFHEVLPQIRQTGSYSVSGNNYFPPELSERWAEIKERENDVKAAEEIEILRDTNYLLIKATPEYETNKNPLSPTNRILTSLLSADRFLFILELSNERQVNQAI